MELRQQGGTLGRWLLALRGRFAHWRRGLRAKWAALAGGGFPGSTGVQAALRHTGKAWSREEPAGFATPSTQSGDKPTLSYFLLHSVNVLCLHADWGGWRGDLGASLQ